MDPHIDFRFDHLGKMLALITDYQEPDPAAIELILGDRAKEYRTVAERSKTAVSRVVERLLKTELAEVFPSVDVRSRERLLFVGDSLTADWQSWRAILVELLTRRRPDLGLQSIDQSVSGATTVDLIRRARYMTLASPSLSFVMIGTNDSLRVGLRASKPLVGKDEFRANLLEIRRHLIDAGSRRIVWLSPPPVDEEMVMQNLRGEAVPVVCSETLTTEYAELVLELFGADAIDTRMAMKRGRSEYLRDGLHLTTEGHTAIARQVLMMLSNRTVLGLSDRS